MLAGRHTDRHAHRHTLHIHHELSNCHLFIFIVKLFNLLFFVSFATGYIHSGEIKIFNNRAKHDNLK